MYKKIQRIHLIGIGGIGMSGIAELLQGNGYQVSGSDLKQHDGITRLESLGIQVFQGHHWQNIKGSELVVRSSAVGDDNPEVIAAKEIGIPVIPRAEILAELMRIKYGIAVAGAHGKTTTTSLVSMALMEAEIDPTVVVGGRMDNFGGTNARLGKSEFMVVEADESDGSFNKLTPSIAVVTNLDREHLDFYKSMTNLRKAFLSFLNKVPFYGLCVLCQDDPQLKILRRKVHRRVRTYGFSKDSDYRITHYESTPEGCLVSAHFQNDSFNFSLPIPGKHNALNALAAIVVSDELSIPRNIALKGLSQFTGVQRRYQRRGMVNGVSLIDDYAHHPTEMRSTIAAALEQFPNGKLRVIFQPHRYSRTEDVLDQFSSCFRKCERVGVAPIYAAGETPIEGLSHETIKDVLVKDGIEGAVSAAKPLETMKQFISESSSGDVILTLGAGDLPNVYQHLL